MSFDLCFWYPEEEVTSEVATQIYFHICEMGEEQTLTKPHPNVVRFNKELLATYPPPEDYTDDQIDECPWSSVKLTDSFALLCISGSRVEELLPVILDLAHKHGLACYDPQKGEIFYSVQEVE